MTGPEASAWFRSMVDTCPSRCADVDDDSELDAYTSRVLMWAQATDPSGYAAWSQHALDAEVQRRFAEVMDELIAAGEAVRHIAADGTVTYSKVGA